MELTEAKDVDFSTLSPSQFGISTNSFLPSSRIKDKSRVAQLKARRRSTIGVRGSPETNSLICFRAKQAAQTPPRTPQIFEGSPFLSRGDSLKKKMAAFQSLMEEDEERDEQKKKEENESDKSTLAQDCKNAEDEQKSSASSEQTLSFNSSIKETRSRCRKRKQVGEKEPETRRSSRTAAASASGRMMKTSGRKRGFGNKEVDRSLYGKRDFASKNPLLSPIFEKTSDSLNSTPTRPRSGKHMDGEQDCVRTPSVPQSETVHHLTVSLDTACTRTNEIQQTLSSTERGNLASKASKARRDSGRPVRKRRSSCADTRKELDSPAISSETESQEQPGCTSVCRDSPEHQETTRSVMSCKMDSINTESLNKQLTDERESSSGHTEPGLAPWQRADFSIDDILRPVSRSRGSVRRSLRNRRSVDLQAVGLAWVDHTSPELSKASRRKTRGRLSGVSEPLLSQEPAPNSPQSSVSQLTL